MKSGSAYTTLGLPRYRAITFSTESPGGLFTRCTLAAGDSTLDCPEPGKNVGPPRNRTITRPCAKAALPGPTTDTEAVPSLLMVTVDAEGACAHPACGT